MESFKDKKLYIEFLRTFAIFWVIFNHTEHKGFSLFTSYPANSIEFWIYLFLSVFCKLSVPLFFAISGSLLLNKEESIKDVYLKRITKICIALIVFSFIFYLQNIHDTSGTLSLHDFFKQLYISDWNYSYWYLYAFIPFLMSLPLLRPLVQNMKKEHFYYLFVCAIFFMAILPIGEYLLWHGKYTLNKNFRMAWIISDIVLYPCLGYFLEHKLDIEKIKKWILPLWLINFITIFISCFMTFYKANLIDNYDISRIQTFYMSFVPVNVTTVFITAKYFFTKNTLSPTVSKIILSLGSATFGIYLLHILFLYLPVTISLWPLLRDTLHINKMIVTFIICFLIMAVCYVITIITKKIPFINKLI